MGMYVTPPHPPPPRSITGGNDKQGFPMAQGILTDGRVRLLMAKGAVHYRPRKEGERKRRSVRGCIVGADLAVLNLSIVKKGDADVEGLTNDAAERPRRLGPKRASKIRKLFNLSAGEDVRKYVVTRTFKTKKDKERSKRPKIQRLVTPLTLQHKRQALSAQRKQRESVKEAKKVYEQLVVKRRSEETAARLSAKLRRTSSRKASMKKEAVA